ncbi:MAG: folate-binding protein [Xenococcaceae cyanobacterium MO_207.B15]|nr:folate-binding protein [Xenococcaceae cyanobacterium MO_207.B15]
MNYQPEQVLLCDRSSWGLLQITGAERLNYLHNQSTNKFDHLKPGEGCETVFVTSTARTLDLATTYVTEDAVLVIVSPQRHEYLLKWLDRFIFPFDKVELRDISSENSIFTIFWEKSATLLQKLGLDSLIGQPEGNHQLLEIEDIPVRVAVGSDLGIAGYNLIFPSEYREKLQQKLLENGVKLISDREWEQLRILQGRPAPDRELTEDYNPLEAGLWQTISFDKGCYIGQETIARLNTYNGVKQKLWGIKLSQEVTPPTPVTAEGSKVGMLTSCTVTPDGIFGLAYIKTKAGGIGLKVTVGDSIGEIITVPFVQHPD